MNQSKSLPWLRQHSALQDKTSYYSNQQHKHSTQNLMLADSQEKRRQRSQLCCREGQLLSSSEETANCSACGQFFIMTVSADFVEGVERRLGRQGAQRERKRVRTRLPHFHRPQEHEAQID